MNVKRNAGDVVGFKDSGTRVVWALSQDGDVQPFLGDTMEPSSRQRVPADACGDGQSPIKLGQAPGHVTLGMYLKIKIGLQLMMSRVRQ